MSATPYQIGQLNATVSASAGMFTNLSKINVPFTTITGRAQCVDPSTDHAPRFGIDRIMFQSIELVQGEQGPSAQPVFKPINDIFDRVRFVGYWQSLNVSFGYGPLINAANSSTSDYVEITFYGTGLNLLSSPDSSATITLSVDGGSTTSVSFTANALLAQRNYNTNTLYSFSAINGLTLGIHTVKISCTGVGNSANFSGYEVVTATSTLQYVPGTTYINGQANTNPSLITDGYASNFASGTLNSTYGGHVVVYQTHTGGIAKAVQSNSGGVQYLSNANHSNESVIRYYNWREFGAGRGTNTSNNFIGDDFSNANSTPGNKAFTLDDNTTTLMGTGINMGGGLSPAAPDTISVNTSSFLTFQFVGTGCDMWGDYGNTVAALGTVYVDGVNTGGNYVRTATPGSIVKLVSGLPYGTHTIQISVTSGADLGAGFIVYGPSKPAIPSGAVELCDYYLLGSFVPNSTQNNLYIAQGVIRKVATREFIYSGTWPSVAFSVGSPNGGGAVGFTTGWAPATTTPTSFFQYTFFGTGFDLRFADFPTVASWTMTIDGATPSAAGATSSSFYGQATAFSLSTGVVNVSNGNNSASGVWLNGLPLGLHTVKVTLTSGGGLQPEALDIITPVHSPKLAGPGVNQNTLTIGNCTLGDSRKFSSQSVKTLGNWSQAVGVSSDVQTTSTSPVPLPDMICTIKTSGNPIQIDYSVLVLDTTAVEIDITAYVDGIPVGNGTQFGFTSTGQYSQMAYGLIVPIAAGVHTVQLYWNAGAASIVTARSRSRILRVRELD